MLLLVIRIIWECKFADIKCCADFLFSRWNTWKCRAIRWPVSHRMYIHQFSRTGCRCACDSFAPFAHGHDCSVDKSASLGHGTAFSRKQIRVLRFRLIISSPKRNYFKSELDTNGKRPFSTINTIYIRVERFCRRELLFGAHSKFCFREKSPKYLRFELYHIQAQYAYWSLSIESNPLIPDTVLTKLHAFIIIFIYRYIHMNACFASLSNQ